MHFLSHSPRRRKGAIFTFSVKWEEQENGLERMPCAHEYLRCLGTQPMNEKFKSDNLAGWAC